jgi:hypothetical protein
MSEKKSPQITKAFAAFLSSLQNACAIETTILLRCEQITKDDQAICVVWTPKEHTWDNQKALAKPFLQTGFNTFFELSMPYGTKVLTVPAPLAIQGKQYKLSLFRGFKVNPKDDVVAKLQSKLSYLC